MNITINGEPKTIDGTMSVHQLLEHLGHAGQRLAVELNGEIVPKSQHSITNVKEGDVIEIVIAVGGG